MGKSGKLVPVKIFRKQVVSSKEVVPFEDEWWWLGNISPQWIQYFDMLVIVYEY